MSSQFLLIPWANPLKACVCGLGVLDESDPLKRSVFSSVPASHFQMTDGTSNELAYLQGRAVVGEVGGPAGLNLAGGRGAISVGTSAECTPPQHEVQLGRGLGCYEGRQGQRVTRWDSQGPQQG